jgi:S-disulfanyl-L-cysteine oxidoreductase SoxD
MRKRALLAACALIGLGWAGQARDVGAAGPRLGRPVAPDVIARMDLTVTPDGAGLPAGSGTVAEGRATYAAKCAACHGAAGSGGVADRLTGGIGALASPKPIKTVASYWPYATTIFDYVRRAMPLTAPQSLTDQEVYGLVAYLLSVDGIVPEDAMLDARTLPQVTMPNRDGFVSLEAQDFDGNTERGGKPR